MNRKVRPFYIGALAVTGVGLLGMVFAPKAHAGGWDKVTIVIQNFGQTRVSPYVLAETVCDLDNAP